MMYSLMIPFGEAGSSQVTRIETDDVASTLTFCGLLGPRMLQQNQVIRTMLQGLNFRPGDISARGLTQRRPRANRNFFETCAMTAPKACTCTCKSIIMSNPSLLA